jgi:hypothetical protein
MNNKKEYVTIDFSTLFGDLFSMSVLFIYCYFYLIFYMENSNTPYDFWKKTLLVCLIMDWIQLFYNFMSFLNDLGSYGCTLLKEDHLKKIRFSLMLKNLSGIVLSVNSIILVFKFIPFTHETCKPYSYQLCIFGRIQAFLGMISFIICGFLVYLLIMICICGKVEQYERSLRFFNFESEKTPTRTYSTPNIPPSSIISQPVNVQIQTNDLSQIDLDLESPCVALQ